MQKKFFMCGKEYENDKVLKIILKNFLCLITDTGFFFIYSRLDKSVAINNSF